MDKIFDTLIFPSIIATIIAIVVGAVSTYISSKKLEKFRIKSVIIQSHIDKVIKLLKCIDNMSVAFKDLNKRYSDLTINIKMDTIEQNLVVMPSIIDDKVGELDEVWHSEFSSYSEDVNKFSTKEIICFNHIVREYLITLDNVLMQVDSDNKWQIGYITTKDLRCLAELYQQHLYNFLNKKIYKPKYNNKYNEKLVCKYRDEILEKTRLYKEKDEIQKLFYYNH